MTMVNEFDHELEKKLVAEFDVKEFLAEMENFGWNNVISEYELDGIRFHPQTNVGEKVIQEHYDEIEKMLKMGYHSIAIKRGKKGCKPTVIYRLPGGKSIWQQMAEEMGEFLGGISADDLRHHVVLSGKQVNYERLHGIPG